MKQAVLLIFIINGIVGCGGMRESSILEHEAEEVVFPYQLRMTLAHDQSAFTQGLVYHRGKLIESTGGDNSWIAEYDFESANYEKKVVLDQNYFGEGITVLNDRLFQLTWKSKVGFVYDVNTFEKIGEFAYDFEGWGITHDNQHLIISDGTEKLHYFDTLGLVEVITKSIKHHNNKAYNLNELEFIDGFIYANQWETNYILKIDTAKSEVVREYDLGYIARENKRRNPRADVLNGIAYNPETKDVFVTGKLWPYLYVIRFNE